MIWHQIQAAKKDRRDLHVTFLDLANAFDSVPHELLWESFSFCTRAHHYTGQELLPRPAAVLHNSRLHYNMEALGSRHHGRLHTVSPLIFTMAMEVIMRASKWVVGGERTRAGLRLPPIRAYMDDMTTLTSTWKAAGEHRVGPNETQA